MKKLAILSVTILIAISAFQIQAQEVKKESANTPIKETKKEFKTELKAERKALRKLEGSEVSVLSKNNFNTDFGAIPDVVWRRSKNYDEAIFTKNGKTLTAYYDFDSKLVGTTSIIKFTDAPAVVQNVIKKQYKNYTIGQVIFFDDNEVNDTDMMLMDIQFDDENNYFVELTKGTSTIMVRVDSGGHAYFFKQL